MQAVFRTDIIALAAEDTLGDPDSYPFCIRYKFDCIGWTDPDTHFTSDARVPIIGDLAPIPGGRLNGRMNRCLSC